MKHITDPSELEVGREYWLVDKRWDLKKISECKSRTCENLLFFENHIWAYETNNQAFKQWDIFGPLPIRTAPDFEALKAQKLLGPIGQWVRSPD